MVEATLELTKVGLVIGENDTAIAGHAIASECVLVTNNVREFSRVPGLPCEDWVH
jgi:tRNA(fMet)-specific endonuclease VapC